MISLGPRPSIAVRCLWMTAVSTSCISASEPSNTNTVTPVIAAGSDHTCALTSDGTAYCWGVTSAAPVAVGGVRFTTLAAGYGYTCGLTSGGVAYCWGSNITGSGSSSATPVPVAGGLSFTAIAAGGFHTCGLASAGVAYCWGDNGEGALGTGTTANSTVPVPVTGSLRFRALTAGGAHTCGLTIAGAACTDDAGDSSPFPGAGFRAAAPGWTVREAARRGDYEVVRQQ